MRPGPATRAAWFVDLFSCHPAARSCGSTLLVRQRSEECHIYQYGLHCRDSMNRVVANLAVIAAANPLQERTVKEAAMPSGNRSCAHARFQFPPAIHPREFPPATSVTANRRSASFEICHVFAEPTLRQNVATRNGKTFRPCAEAVDDETSLWKTEENMDERFGLNSVKEIIMTNAVGRSSWAIVCRPYRAGICRPVLPLRPEFGLSHDSLAQ